MIVTLRAAWGRSNDNVTRAPSFDSCSTDVKSFLAFSTSTKVPAYWSNNKTSKSSSTQTMVASLSGSVRMLV